MHLEKPANSIPHCLRHAALARLAVLLGAAELSPVFFHLILSRLLRLFSTAESRPNSQSSSASSGSVAHPAGDDSIHSIRIRSLRLLPEALMSCVGHGIVLHLLSRLLPPGGSFDATSTVYAASAAAQRGLTSSLIVHMLVLSAALPATTGRMQLGLAASSAVFFAAGCIQALTTQAALKLLDPKRRRAHVELSGAKQSVAASVELQLQRKAVENKVVSGERVKDEGASVRKNGSSSSSSSLFDMLQELSSDPLRLGSSTEKVDDGEATALDSEAPLPHCQSEDVAAQQRSDRLDENRSTEESEYCCEPLSVSFALDGLLGNLAQVVGQTLLHGAVAVLIYSPSVAQQMVLSFGCFLAGTVPQASCAGSGIADVWTVAVASVASHAAASSLHRCR
jgi:hypothetical protein